MHYRTPKGTIYTLYSDMLQQTHLLIAGATGSGKSVVIDGILHTALYQSPAKIRFILIDLKRVELIDYKQLPHTIMYADTGDAAINALKQAITIIERRFNVMQRKRIKKFDGSHIYVVIDELADLMTTRKKEVLPLIQRIAQIGRAANVHIIAATQTPIAAVLPTQIKCNFDSRVGLRTRSKQDSINILGFAGLETLPKYGCGYYMTPDQSQLYQIPMIEETERKRILKYWSNPIHYLRL